MSPEQCSGDRIGTASDTYSLACVFYEVLAGKPPLAGASPMDTLMKHINEDPEPFKPGLNVPPKLELAIMTALNKAPEDRQPHIKQFRDEILEAGGLKFIPGLQNTLEKTIQPQKVAAIPEDKIIERAGDASGVGNAYQPQDYQAKASTGYKKSAPAGGAAAGTPPTPKANPATAIVAVLVAVLLIGGVGFLAYQKFQDVIIVEDSKTGSGKGTNSTDTKGGDTDSTDTSTSGEDSSTTDDGTSAKDGDTDSTKVASTDGTDSSGTDTSSDGSDSSSGGKDGSSDGTDSSKSGDSSSSTTGTGGTDSGSKTDGSVDGSKQGDGTTGTGSETEPPVTVRAKHLGADEMLELSKDPTFNLTGKLRDTKPEPLLAAPRAGVTDKCEIIPFVLTPKTATAKQAADSVYKELFEKSATWKSTALTVTSKFKDVVVQELSFNGDSNVKEYIVYVKNEKPEFLLGCQFVPKKVTEKELHEIINSVIPKLHSLLAQ
jgi:Protein kinase domain.